MRYRTELQEGSKIHLKEMRGVYTVVMVCSNGVYISCKSWIARAGYPDIIPTKFYEYDKIKSLAGGMKNYKINHKRELINEITTGNLELSRSSDRIALVKNV